MLGGAVASPGCCGSGPRQLLLARLTASPHCPGSLCVGGGSSIDTLYTCRGCMLLPKLHVLWGPGSSASRLLLEAEGYGADNPPCDCSPLES